MKTIGELLKHFENRQQWVDICHPQFHRMGEKFTLQQDEELMNMEFSKWSVSSTNVLNIDL